MINSYISQQIERNFPYKPTDDQFLALHTLTEFLLSEEPDSLLLMKGYAGTGKTSLVGALVKTLNELKQKTFLLAPTGRYSILYIICMETGGIGPRKGPVAFSGEIFLANAGSGAIANLFTPC